MYIYMAPSSLLLYTLLISANNYCPRTQKPRKTRQKMAQESSINRASRRTRILNNHLVQSPSDPTSCLRSNSCLSYTPPEETESLDFDTKEMRKILDLHNLEDRDWLFGVIKQGKVFNGKERGGRLFVLPDYNQTMEQQREMTMKRIEYLFERGVFDGWLMKKGVEAELKKLAFLDVIQNFDQSLAVMLGVHFFLWYYIDFCFLLLFFDNCCVIFGF